MFGILKVAMCLSTTLFLAHTDQQLCNGQLPLMANGDRNWITTCLQPTRKIGISSKLMDVIKTPWLAIRCLLTRKKETSR